MLSLLDKIKPPIRYNLELVEVKLKIPKKDCKLVFYSPTSGEIVPTLQRSAHWQLIHNTIPDFELYVKEVYDDMISDFYYVKFQVYFGDLTEIGKYVVNSIVDNYDMEKSHIKYSYR